MVALQTRTLECIVCGSTEVDPDDLCDACDEPICANCLLEANNDSGTIACSEDCLEQIYG